MSRELGSKAPRPDFPKAAAEVAVVMHSLRLQPVPATSHCCEGGAPEPGLGRSDPTASAPVNPQLTGLEGSRCEAICPSSRRSTVCGRMTPDLPTSKPPAVQDHRHHEHCTQAGAVNSRRRR